MQVDEDGAAAGCDPPTAEPDHEMSEEPEDFTYLVLAFAIRHGLSKSAIDDLLDLLGVVGKQSIPSSKYILLKSVLEDVSSVTEQHTYCDKCLSYIGPRDVACPECGDPTRKADRVKQGSFFMYVPLKEQIRQLLVNGTIESQLVLIRSEDGSIRDSVDGCVSRKAGTDESLISASHLSLTWNVDGVPIHQSSKKSIYPILAIINEIVPEKRGDEILMCGVWFGKGSLSWSTFCTPFMKELEELSTTGISWEKDGLSKTTVVSTHSVVCDSVARCSIQGMQQFNGTYGCGWCQQQTVPAERSTGATGSRASEVTGPGSGLARVYPFCTGVEPRTQRNVIQCAKEASEKGLPHCKGVKQASPLLLLPEEAGVDIVDSFAVDYMHAVLLGVVRQFLRLWFGSEYSSAEFSVRKSVGGVNKRLTSIRPPHDIARTPRRLEDYDTWKASECRSWLLFFSVPVLSGILPAAFLDHWCLLVGAMFLLLEEEISEGSIRRAEQCLSKFVKQTQSLYGLRHMSSNVHLLLHLSDTVKRLGPLWSCSAFPFERYMMTLKFKLFHGTTFIPQQIVSNMLLHNMVRRWLSGPASRERYLAKKWLGYPKTDCGVRSDAGVIGLHRRRVQLGERELELLSSRMGMRLTMEVDSFERAIVRGKVVCTERYGQSHKRNSYTMDTKFGICTVDSILFLPSNGLPRACLIVKLHEPTSHSYHRAVTHLVTVRATTTRMVCRPDDIRGNVVVVSENSGNRTMVCAIQPNRYEKD